MGAAPMLWLARALISAGRRPRAALGFQSATDVCLAEDLRELGVETVVATADGSEGTRGFVTDAMRNMQFDYVFACGPEPMLRAVSTGTDCPGQMSFEERMGCGFGACMGCTCKTIAGEKRICREGPVLFKEEVRW